jgi:hypothetical protein
LRRGASPHQRRDDDPGKRHGQDSQRRRNDDPSASREGTLSSCPFGFFRFDLWRFDLVVGV